MKHHTYVKFKSVFSKSKRPSAQTKARLRRIQFFSVCLHLLHLQESCSQVFPRNEFSEHLSLDSQAPHPALGFECVSSATTRGQASVSGGALGPQGPGSLEETKCTSPSHGLDLFPNGKIHAGMSRFAFCIPLISDRSFGSPFFGFLFPPSQSPSDCNK